MSLCPKCGRCACGHTLEERGQTYKEVMRRLTSEELDVLASGNEAEKIRLAQENAHLSLD